jgi:hypothetical protein
MAQYGALLLEAFAEYREKLPVRIVCEITYGVR